MNLQFFNYTNNLNRETQNPNPLLRFNRNVVNYSGPAPVPYVNKPPLIPQDNQLNAVKMKWGAPTWFLFHTLAEKVKSDHFPRIKNELIGKIIIICKNLPCPKCAGHATDYLSKINFNAINTKEDFKNMLFIFHNEVNTRKNITLFTRSELDSKYVKANTLNIINNFFYFFQNNSFNINLITNKMHAAMALTSFKDWMQDNLQYFDL
jgi:hypothetical protein